MSIFRRKQRQTDQVSDQEFSDRLAAIGRGLGNIRGPKPAPGNVPGPTGVPGRIGPLGPDEREISGPPVVETSGMLFWPPQEKHNAEA